MRIDSCTVARMDYKKFLADAAKRREEIRKLREIGWTWTEIAKHFGISPQRAQQLGKAKS